MTNTVKKLALAAAALAAPTILIPTTAFASQYGGNAHVACKSDETQGKIVGGVLGAVVGGVIGSNIAGSGVQDEGTAIGAVLGGLAGAGIADQRVDCDPRYTNPHSSNSYQSQPVYTPAHTPSYEPAYQPATHQATSYQTTRYEDRVTYSDHPVYSDPNYGATYGTGAVTYGTTYNTGYTSYPATQPAPAYRQATSYRTVSTAPVYRTVTPQPVYGQRAYTKQVRKAQRRARRHANHYHGKYVCNDHH